MRGNRGNIVVLDDDPFIIQYLEEAILAHNVSKAQTLSESSQLLRRGNTDLAIVDLDFGGSQGVLAGIDYIKTLRKRYPNLAIMVLSKHSKTSTVVDAIQNGADDFQAKGSVIFDSPEFRNKVNQLVNLKRERVQKNQKFQIRHWGNSPESKKIKDKLSFLADSKNPFFLIAEPGSNSRRFIRHLYLEGYDVDELKEPVFVDLSVLSNEMILEILKGRYQNKEIDFLRRANKTILFARHVVDCPLDIQRGFIGVLEQKRYLESDRKLDIQFVFGIEKNPRYYIEKKKLSQELFNKIKEVTITPLRERKEDILPLIDDWMQNIGLDSDLLGLNIRNRFLSYSYPGNEGELLNILDRMLNNHKARHNKGFLKSEISWQSIPTEVLERSEDLKNLKFDMARLELSYIDNALRLCDGIIKDAAEALSISFEKKWNKDNLRYRINKYKKEYPDLLREYKKIVECYNLD